MVYTYIITLKNTGRKHIDTFSLLLLTISMLLFLREQYLSADTKIVYLVAGLAIAAIIARNFYQQKKDNRTVYYRIALFIAAIGWAMMPWLSWLFIPFVLLGVFEQQAKLPLQCGFGAAGITITTFLCRKHPWTDFNNIVLKDNLLTLDFKNNRLLQRETADERDAAGEAAFNIYCREQLGKTVSF